MGNKADALRSERYRVRATPEEVDEWAAVALPPDKPRPPRWVGRWLRGVGTAEARYPRQLLLDRCARLEASLAACAARMADVAVGGLLEEIAVLSDHVDTLRRVLAIRDHQVQQLLPGTLLGRAQRAEAERDHLRERLERALACLNDDNPDGLRATLAHEEEDANL